MSGTSDIITLNEPSSFRQRDGNQLSLRDVEIDEWQWGNVVNIAYTVSGICHAC